ncbi:MAG TPA: hypothetical protein VM537_17600 [Anaerolineae bacterium]|nr:hypothetical protein [Anaerolineae bacterium]
MLNIEALERALASIEEVGHGELTFNVGESGMSVTLGMLLPDQEIEVQRWAQEVLDANEDAEGNNPRDSAMEFLDRWKYGILSYAILRIGDADFRGQDYVLTGEHTNEGVPIKKPKHLVVRDLIRKLWHRPMLSMVFHKYTELTEKAEMKAEKAVQFTPAELEVEISRLEKRLEELRAKQEERDGPRKDPVADQFRTTNELANQSSPDVLVAEPSGENRAQRRQREQQERRDAKAVRKEAAPETRAAPQAPPQRERAIPKTGAAPSRAPEPPPPAPEPPAEEQGPREIMGSFADGDDEAAMEAETQRILAARRAVAQAEAEGTNVPGPEHQARVDAAARSRQATMAADVGPVPPHREAANTAAAVFDAGGGDVHAARAGSVGGVEAHRTRPTETLSRRSRTPAPGKKEGPPLDQAPKGTRNPNFKPPG